MATLSYASNYDNHESESESDYETKVDLNVQQAHRYNLCSTTQQQSHMTGTVAEGSLQNIHLANNSTDECFEVIVIGNDNDQLHHQSFTCGVCYELMVNPTTLQCGHSFCRHCLATWCVSAQKHQCPSCRQHFSGLPKVSVNLRSTIQSQLPAQYASRENSVSTVDSFETIKKFEQQFSAIQTQELTNLVTHVLHAQQRLQLQQARESFRDPKAWITIAIIAVLAITVWTGFGWLLGGAQFEPMTNKQMKKWTEAETGQWLTSLGAWVEPSLVEKFAEAHIDGALLAVLNEDDVIKMAPDLDTLYKRALIRERDDALIYCQKHKRRPADFWQYKEAYLFKALFASDYIRGMPRTFVFYILLFDYEEGFLPLVHTLLPQPGINYTDHTQELPSATLEQWFDFAWRAVVPHIGIFLPLAYTTIWTSNFPTALWIMAILIVCAINNTLNMVIWYIMSPFDRAVHFQRYCNTIVSGAITYTSIYMLWNFIPSFIINLFFYCNLCSACLLIFSITLTIKDIYQLV